MKVENNMFKTILESSQTGFVVFDEQLNVLYVNPYMESLSHESCPLLTHLWTSQTNFCLDVTCCQCCDEQMCDVLHVLKEVACDKKRRSLNHFLVDTKTSQRRLNGSVQWLDGYVVMELQDITCNHQSSNLIENLLDSIDELLCYKDEQLKYQYINKAYAQFLGKSKEEVLNLTDHELLSPELAMHCINSDLLTLQNGQVITYEEAGDVVYKVRKLKYKKGIFFVGKDVTKEHYYGKLAYVDQLTGVYNRHKFMEDISSIYRLENKNYYLGIIDLDGLRDLNNTYGHHKGDSYLATLGRLLQRIFKEVSYRIGGDEFAILLTEEESKLQNQINQLFDELKQLNLQPQLTISMGVRTFDCSLSYEENYEKTDQLLYRVKQAGKNHVIYDI